MVLRSAYKESGLVPEERIHGMAKRPRAVVHGIKGGVSGVRATLGLMAMKARGRPGKAEGAKHPIVNMFAGKVVKQYGCKAKDYT